MPTGAERGGMFIKLPSLKKEKLVFNSGEWSGTGSWMFANCAIKNPPVPGATKDGMKYDLPNVQLVLDAFSSPTRDKKRVYPFSGFLGELKSGVLVRIFTDGEGFIVCIPETQFQMIESAGLALNWFATSRMIFGECGDRLIVCIALIRYDAEKFMARIEALKSAVYGKAKV